VEVKLTAGKAFLIAAAVWLVLLLLSLALIRWQIWDVPRYVTILQTVFAVCLWVLLNPNVPKTQWAKRLFKFS
jgi:hypothetical protein